jgi:hypothetical protein
MSAQYGGTHFVSLQFPFESNVQPLYPGLYRQYQLLAACSGCTPGRRSSSAVAMMNMAAALRSRRRVFIFELLLCVNFVFAEPKPLAVTFIVHHSRNVCGHKYWSLFARLFTKEAAVLLAVIEIRTLAVIARLPRLAVG